MSNKNVLLLALCSHQHFFNDLHQKKTKLYLKQHEGEKISNFIASVTQKMENGISPNFQWKFSFRNEKENDDEFQANTFWKNISGCK